MKNLFNDMDTTEILNRLGSLSTGAKRQWGKMEVAQMLAHCHASLETAAGLNFPKRIFLGYILSPFLKPKFVSDKPFDKNYPTDKSYIFTTTKGFEVEKEKLKKLIIQFSQGGSAKCTTHPHSFFGRLTPEQWAKTQYKHLDHHLRQFGV